MTDALGGELGVVQRQIEEVSSKLDMLIAQTNAKGDRLKELHSMTLASESRVKDLAAQLSSLKLRVQSSSGSERNRLIQEAKGIAPEYTREHSRYGTLAQEHNLLRDELLQLSRQYDETFAQLQTYTARFEALADAERKNRRERWEKTKSSFDSDTGLMQTDFFSGVVGGTDQKKKVHVAINELSEVVFVRDEDGTILYDKKNNIGHLPHDLNWSRG